MDIDVFFENLRHFSVQKLSKLIPCALVARPRKREIYITLLKLLKIRLDPTHWLDEYPQALIRPVIFFLSDRGLILTESIEPRDSYDGESTLFTEPKASNLEHLFSTFTKPRRNNCLHNSLRHIQNNQIIKTRISMIILKDNIVGLQSVMAEPNSGFSPPDNSTINFFLTQAAAWGSIKCFRHLLLNLVGELTNGDVLCNNAIKGGNHEIIQRVLELGYNPVPCLDTALRFFRTDVIIWLHHNFDIDITEALKGAISCNNMMAFLLFIENHPDILFSEHFLHVAARSGNNTMIKYLLAHGYDINVLDNFEESPLIAAAEFHNFGTCHSLVKHGAFVGQISTEGKTCLQYCAASEDPNFVRYLLKNGGQRIINQVMPGHLCTLPIVVCRSLPVLEILIEYGADVNFRDPESSNRSALSFAASEGDLNRIKFLLSKGARYDDNSSRCLRNALIHHHFDVAEYFLQIGMDINLLHKEMELAHFAIVARNLMMIKFLVSHGVDLNAENYISDALMYGSLEIALYLFSIGSDVLRKNTSVIKLLRNEAKLQQVEPTAIKHMAMIGSALFEQSSPILAI